MPGSISTTAPVEQTTVTTAPWAKGILFLVQKADMGMPGGTKTGFGGVAGVVGCTGAGRSDTDTLNCELAWPAVLGNAHAPIKAAHVKAITWVTRKVLLDC